jgi:hypothetical protein
MSGGLLWRLEKYNVLYNNEKKLFCPLGIFI